MRVAVELTDEQKKALDTASHVCMSAGAGTGKTRALAARYVAVLDRAAMEAEMTGQNPEEAALDAVRGIVAVTFTTAAATELKARVTAAIEERAWKVSPFWTSAMLGMAEARIGTIHSLCLSILRSDPLASGLPPAFEILRDDRAEELRAEAASRVASRWGQAERDDIDAAARILPGRKALVETLAAMLAKRYQSDAWSDACVRAAKGGSVDKEAAKRVLRERCPLSCQEAEDFLKTCAVRDAIKYFASLNCEAFAAGNARVRELVAGLAGPSRLLLSFVNCAGPGQPRAADGAVSDASLPPYVLAPAIGTLAKAFLKDGKLKILNKLPGRAESEWSRAGIDKREFEQHYVNLGEMIGRIWPLPLLAMSDEDLSEAAGPAAALTRLYMIARSEFDALKDGACDFDDLLRLTRNLLTRDERARRAASCRHIMVDEFQDTDPIQWEILATLAGLRDAEPEAPSGGQIRRELDSPAARSPSAAPAARVMLVGDGKQSIFRFRNADVTVFAAAREQLRLAAKSEGGSGKDGHTYIEANLTENFRSLPNVVEIINRVFERIFAPAQGCETRRPYEARPQVLKPRRTAPPERASSATGGRVELLLVLPERGIEDGTGGTASGSTPEEDGERGGDEKGERGSGRLDMLFRQAEAVAARLRQMIDNKEEILVQDKTGTERPRPVTADDMAILLRRRTNLAAWLAALRSFGLPYTVLGGTGFYSTPEITDCLNFLAALDDPRRDSALAGWLLSPMAGLSWDGLTAAAAASRSAGASGTLYDGLLQCSAGGFASAEDREAAVEARETIEAGRTEAAFEPVSKVLRRALSRSGYLAACGYPDRHAQAAANLEKLLDLIAIREGAGRGSLRELVSWLEARSEADAAEPEASVCPEGVGGVRVMTVHAAKGLEFPVAAVPEMEAETAEDIEHGIIIEDAGAGPMLLAKGIRRNPGIEPNPAYSALREIRWMKTGAESKRLFYVACTRAADVLILAGCAAGKFRSRGVRWLDYVPLFLSQREHYPDGEDAAEWIRSIEDLKPGVRGRIGHWMVFPDREGRKLEFKPLEPAAINPPSPPEYSQRFADLIRIVADYNKEAPSRAPSSSIATSVRTAAPIIISPTEIERIFAKPADIGSTGNGSQAPSTISESGAMDGSGASRHSAAKRASGVEPVEFGLLFHAVARMLPAPEETIRRACRTEVSRAVLNPRVDRDRLEEEICREVLKTKQALEPVFAARRSYAELPFALSHKNAFMVRGRLDRLWFDEVRKVWEVVDYKTEIASEETGKTDMTGTSYRRYEIQLKIYAAAAMRVLERWKEKTDRIALALYFTVTGHKQYMDVTREETERVLNMLSCKVEEACRNFSI